MGTNSGNAKFGWDSLTLLLILVLASTNFASYFGYGKEYLWGEIGLSGFFLVLMSLNGRELKVDRRVALIGMGFFVFLLTNLLRTGPDKFLPSANFILNVLGVPFLAYVLGNNIRAVGLVKVFRMMALGLAIISLVQFYLYANEKGSNDFSGTMLSGSIFGGVASLYALIFAAIYANTKKRIDLLLALASVLLLVLSGHRTGIMALVLSLGILFTLSANKGMIRRIISLLVLVLIGGLVLLITLKFFPQVITEQFFGGEIAIDTIRTSGRKLIWATLFESWTSSLDLFLWGGGLGYSTYLIAHSHGDTLESIAIPHNEWLRVAVDMGILGVGAIVLYFNTLLGGLSKELNPVHYALASHMVVEMFFSNVLYWSGSYVFILVLFCAITKKYCVYGQ